jgi:hypothetical protein
MFRLTNPYYNSPAGSSMGLIKVNDSPVHNVTMVSLGGTCCVAQWIKERIHQPTQFFDWLGTPAWAIIEILQPTYKSIFYPDCIHEKGSEGSRHCELNNNRIHKTKLLSFYHDNEKSIPELFNTYNRRHQRFYQEFLLNTNKKAPMVFFIRFEIVDVRYLDLELNELLKTKIPAQRDNYVAEKHEMEKKDIQELSRHLQKHFPSCNYRLIYLSQYLPFEYFEHVNDKIVYIKLESFNPAHHWIFSSRINTVIYKHAAKLQKIIDANVTTK